MKNKTLNIIVLLAILLSFINVYGAINTCYAYAYCGYPYFNGVECDRNNPPPFPGPVSCWSCTSSCTYSGGYAISASVECECLFLVTSIYTNCHESCTTCFQQVGPGDLPGS